MAFVRALAQMEREESQTTGKEDVPGTKGPGAECSEVRSKILQKPSCTGACDFQCAHRESFGPVLS